MNENHHDYVTLTAGNTSLVISCAIGTRPNIIYWGRRLPSTEPEMIKLMATRQHAHGSADVDLEPSLLNEIGGGLAGHSGFVAHRGGYDWGILLTVSAVERPNDNEVKIICDDTSVHVRAVHTIFFDPASHIVTYQTAIINNGKDDLALDWCAASCLPIDQKVSKYYGFTGRWSGEFVLEEITKFTGSYVRENKKGRTSHDCVPALLACGSETNEQNGIAFGFHLGWSGNSRLRLDQLSDGRTFLQLGEYFYPGEMSLKAGEQYQTPVLYAGYSDAGLSALSRQFHHHLKNSVMDGRIQKKPRPIHYNTWEAVYFDHDPQKLRRLAKVAANVGVERFVLDDGWFGSRRDDQAGLGDWWPSEDWYPDGLQPLISYVKDLGMEFGIWFEPEMVNPDSDLFRARPDWVLKVESVEQIPFRNQYVLDLTKKEVTEYLFKHIDKVLSENDIDYVKWDMNRDIHHPGSDGRAAISRQTHALYQLLMRLRAAHPDVEIESCSSGGARTDYGILRYTDRIWTSDSNDALDRQFIQRGASHFFPLEIMGAHVGPETCHITGRRLSMELRVATALFGHMGLEMNLLDETPEDIAVLKAGIELHKKHKALLHSGDFHRMDTPEHVNAIGVVAKDKNEALFSWCNVKGHKETLPGRICFVGLESDKKYRVKIVWPNDVKSITSPSIIEAASLTEEGHVFSGEALMNFGLQAPLLYPDTCLIYHLIVDGQD
jgi:alpha-galactosidase